MSISAISSQGYNNNLAPTGTAPSPVLLAGKYRPSKLNDEERFLPANEQMNRLRSAGFVEVGDFSLKLDPNFYGVSIEVLQQVVNNYTRVLGHGGPVDRAALNALVRPVQEQAKQSAPLLSEMNWDLPQGFKNAVRANRVHVEAVYTGFTRGTDAHGPFFQGNARVFVQKY